MLQKKRHGNGLQITQAKQCDGIGIAQPNVQHVEMYRKAIS